MTVDDVGSLNVLLVGPPGSGKGTQAALLTERFGFVHLSTGDLLRDASAGFTRGALRLRQIMGSGALVPDETVLGLLADRIPELQAAGQGFILDGFPRTVRQCVALEQLLGADGIDIAVELEVPRVVVIGRLQSRGRVDDTRDVVTRRQETYRRETAPMIDRLRRQGIVASVNGYGAVEEVHAAIVTQLEVAARTVVADRQRSTVGG